MVRQASAASIWKRVIALFLVFFVAFALLNTGLSFIYQPLFSFLISVPAFTTIALFALLMTLFIRQSAVQQVPPNKIGLVTYANGTLKTLAPAGPVWVWPGKERLSGLLSLEPVSTHAPLPGLKSGDGVELAPLVTIITWRIHATMPALLASEFREQVTAVALESQLQRERRVREKVAETLGRWVEQERLEELEEDVPTMSSNSFGQGVIADVNRALTPLGLLVERLECIGSITTPHKGGRKAKEDSAARAMTESLLRTRAAEASIQEIQARADDVLRRARREVEELREVSRALNDYTQAMLSAIQAHAPAAGGTAQKALSRRMMALAAEAHALLAAAREMKAASEKIER